MRGVQRPGRSGPSRRGTFPGGRGSLAGEVRWRGSHRRKARWTGAGRCARPGPTPAGWQSRCARRSSWAPRWRPSGELPGLFNVVWRTAAEGPVPCEWVRPRFDDAAGARLSAAPHAAALGSGSRATPVPVAHRNLSTTPVAPSPARRAGLGDGRQRWPFDSAPEQGEDVKVVLAHRRPFEGVKLDILIAAAHRGLVTRYRDEIHLFRYGLFMERMATAWHRSEANGFARNPGRPERVSRRAQLSRRQPAGRLRRPANGTNARPGGARLVGRTKHAGDVARSAAGGGGRDSGKPRKSIKKQ